MVVKAIAHLGYGKPEKVVRLEETEKPVPTEKQVLVRVVASSINAGDWRAVTANPGFVRLMSGFRRPRDRALGGDFAGVVEAVGSTETHAKVGDEVYGIRTGSLAEYVATENAFRKPANLTFQQAAAVPIAAVTALQALQKHGGLSPGQSVAINGAGGGVGTFAVQIAKALGGVVTAVTTADHVDLVRSLGADHVVDYTRDDFTKGGKKYDLIVDISGRISMRSMRRALAAEGKIILVGAGNGSLAVLGRVVGGVIRRRLRQPVKFFVAYGPYEDQFSTLTEMIEAGKVKPVIDRTYSLAEVPQALTYAAAGKTRGKISIEIEPA